MQENIPVIEDIFRFFDNARTGLSERNDENAQERNLTNQKETGLYYDYKKFSNAINITQESNGIKFKCWYFTALN
jgi:hypothetical protein